MKTTWLGFSLALALSAQLPANAATAPEPPTQNPPATTIEVTLSGAVKQPGRFRFPSQVGGTPKDVILHAGGFLEEATAVVVRRENAKGEIETIEVEVGRMLCGPRTEKAPPFLLKDGDEIVVLSKE